MNRQKQSLFIGQLVEHLHPYLARTVWPDTVAGIEFGPHDLQRAMENVTTEDAHFALRFEPERYLPGAVAGSRMHGQAVGNFITRSHKTGETFIHDRHNTVKE